MNEEAKNLLAQARIQSDFGRKGEAVFLLQRALALAPDDSALLCHLGTAYYQEKQWDKMLVCAERAISMAPNHDWPHRIHSLALRNMERQIEGVAAAREAVRCSPESSVTLDCLIHAMLSCGQLKEAREAAVRMVQVAPEDAASHIAMGHVCRRQWKWADVEQSARQALRIDAESTPALELLAESLSVQRKTKEALACSTLLLQLKPTHAKAQARLHDTFQNPFFIVLTLFASLLWLCFYVVLTPALLPIITHAWIVGLGAFCLALCSTMAVNAIVFKFCPLVFLLPQPAFRQQPAHIQEYVFQECKREWLSNKWAIFVAILFLLALVSVFSLSPYTIYKRFCGLKAPVQHKADDTKIVLR